MAVEARRGCGYRKVGGIYLVTDGGGMPCDRLPIPLTVCPTCNHGIKQSRGWTWLDVAELVGGVHPSCMDEFPCPLCMATAEMGKAGLLWVGEKFYKTPADFAAEANRLGVSRRISAVPREFKVGETWVLLAHPKTVRCEPCHGSGVVPGELASAEVKDFVPCQACSGSGKAPGIFHVVRPRRLEIIVTESQSKDAEYMESLAKRNLTPVVVPDNDKDHQGTVYDHDEDEEEEAATKTASAH